MPRPKRCARPVSRIYCFKEQQRVAAPQQLHSDCAVSRVEMGTIVHLTCCQVSMAKADSRRVDHQHHGIHRHSAINGWKNQHFLHYDEKVNPQ